MEHVVFHPGPDGSPAFRRFASLDEAVRYVEHLRNSEGMTEVSVHSLSPVPVAFRAYYKVEVPVDGAVAEVPPQAVPLDAPAEPAAPEPVAVEPAVEPAPVPAPEPVAVEAPQLVEAPMAEAVVAAEQPSNGKRSLGFFAH